MSALDAAMAMAPEARTVVYVHGIGNKPVASVLKCQWDTALFGVDVGDRSRMAYWVNREYYPTPGAGTCAGGDLVDASEEDAGAAEVRALARAASVDLVEAEIEALADDPKQRDVLRALAAKVGSADDDRAAAAFTALQVSAKVLPLPPFLRRLITRRLTRKFLRDVNDFLFNRERREFMEARLAERLDAGGGPFVVVAHSQGSMIAYDLLRQRSRQQTDVKLLVTIGSPLGIDEVQDVLRQWAGGKLPFPPCVDQWVNVADVLDPVAADSDIRNDFAGGERIINYRGVGLNPDSPRHPHSGTGYLGTAHVRNHVRAAVGSQFGQVVGSFVVARDLAAGLEDALPQERHDVLIQLAQPAAGGHAEEYGERLAGEIEQLAGDRAEDAQVERLQRFVAARLTRSEIELLRSKYRELNIDTVWRDAKKQKLIFQSAATVQARTANVGYGARGQGIAWAVLDTGIWADHPHFQRHANVATQWDCTQRGALAPWVAGPGQRLDGDGHGTHVAGIIAGAADLPLAPAAAPKVLYAGMAPECKLHVYKVLDDQGRGRDSWIIKALDHIASTNERAGELVIHGVNLSLGGGFDPRVYGCGHSPLCQELRRLWRQGVVVCLAAGNEGHRVFAAEEGDVELNVDISIGDPANLDEAIAVGSVHKTNPHTYGISYFSSRGPTADGRRKPDVVAPGEKVISACHRATPNDTDAKELYVEMSGTSMATPHVSGLLAAFLSVRREFIGYPDKVKAILEANCTDLRRDPCFQGSGMPNLVKMLINT